MGAQTARGEHPPHVTATNGYAGAESIGALAEPRRLRWSVPAVDVSTNRWLDHQENISRSLQLLIRESIQRDGYIDVVNRPVEQLPLRSPAPGYERTRDHVGSAPDEDQKGQSGTTPAAQSTAASGSDDPRPAGAAVEGLLDMQAIFGDRR